MAELRKKLEGEVRMKNEESEKVRRLEGEVKREM
jgi:hypothetical protein